MLGCFSAASVVQWIGHKIADLVIEVRLLAEAPLIEKRLV